MAPIAVVLYQHVDMFDPALPPQDLVPGSDLYDSPGPTPSRQQQPMTGLESAGYIIQQRAAGLTARRVAKNVRLQGLLGAQVRAAGGGWWQMKGLEPP
jgi:hypothetical protein